MVRWFCTLFVLIGLGVSLEAQTSMVCDNGETLHAPVTLTAPVFELSPGVTLAPTFIVGTTGTVLPLAQVTVIEGQTVCAAAGSVSPTLMEQGEPVMLNALLAVPEGDNSSTLTFGTSGDSGDVLTVIVENQTLTGRDDYTLSVTDAMRASGVPLEVRVYGLTDADMPRLEIRNANGIARQDDQSLVCVNGEAPCLPLLDTAVYSLSSAVDGKPTDGALIVRLDEWQGDSLRLRVSGAPYVMVLRFANDVPPPALNQADLTMTDTTVALACDGVPMWSDGMTLNIQTTAMTDPISVTVLGLRDEDPILVTSDATTCTDSSPEAQVTSLDLPELSVQPQTTSARVQLAAQASAYIGLSDDLSGTYLIVLENVPVDEYGTLIEVSTTAGMVAANDYMTVWATSTDGALDTILTWTTESKAPLLDFDQLPYTCDNAGNPESCYGETASLRGSSIILGDGRSYPLDSTDSRLQIPIFPDTVGMPLRVLVTGADGTAGTAIVVLRVVTG